jgi:hypothetical protein
MEKAILLMSHRLGRVWEKSHTSFVLRLNGKDHTPGHPVEQA